MWRMVPDVGNFPEFSSHHDYTIRNLLIILSHFSWMREEIGKLEVWIANVCFVLREIFEMSLLFELDKVEIGVNSDVCSESLEY